MRKHADLIYDVGMHRGEDTAFYLKKGFRVVAFEADPNHVQYCRERFRQALSERRLTIVEGAIIDPQLIAAGRTTVTFYTTDDVSEWGTVRDDWAARNQRLGAPSETTTVQTINFVDALRDHGIPHYLKIDIEGSDLVCLEALREYSERPDYISIESDKTRYAGVKREIDLLCALGYTSFQAVEQSAVQHAAPPSPAREGRNLSHTFEFGASGTFGAELTSNWQSRHDILRLYRVIHLGYILLGDDGLMTNWRFLGSTRIRGYAATFVQHYTRAAVPGWYDTHARHASCS